MQRVWSATELAYFAGLLDGEGSFTLHSRGTHIFGSQIHIGNTDIRLLEWVQQHFGGSVSLEQRPNPRHKPVYRWYSDAKTLNDVLAAIAPYLIAKRDRAELMLAYRRTLVGPIDGVRFEDVISDEVKAERSAIHATLQSLNKRGA